ncbi:MAG: KH domain-containing protein [Anaerolineae bacterium]
MKDFIAYLIKNLVDEPDSVDVQVLEGEQGTIVEVRVSPADVARVVGRQGRTIKALRTIAMTVGARFGRRVRLELIHQ